MTARVVRFDDYEGSTLDIGLRLAPLDVGFDLRAEKMRVVVPRETDVASYSPRDDGERYVVIGRVDDIVAVLRGEGYDAVVETT